MSIDTATDYADDIAALNAANIPAYFHYEGHGWNLLRVDLDDGQHLIIGSSSDEQMCLPAVRSELAGWTVSHTRADGDTIDYWRSPLADTDALVALCLSAYATMTA